MLPDPDICLLVRDVLIVALVAVVVLIVLLLIAPSAQARTRKHDRRPLAVLGQGDTRRCIWPSQVATSDRTDPTTSSES